NPNPDLAPRVRCRPWPARVLHQLHAQWRFVRRRPKRFRPGHGGRQVGIKFARTDRAQVSTERQAESHAPYRSWPVARWHWLHASPTAAAPSSGDDDPRPSRKPARQVRPGLREVRLPGAAIGRHPRSRTVSALRYRPDRWSTWRAEYHLLRRARRPRYFGTLSLQPPLGCASRAVPGDSTCSAGKPVLVRYREVARQVRWRPGSLWRHGDRQCLLAVEM